MGSSNRGYGVSQVASSPWVGDLGQDGDTGDRLKELGVPDSVATAAKPGRCGTGPYACVRTTGLSDRAVSPRYERRMEAGSRGLEVKADHLGDLKDRGV